MLTAGTVLPAPDEAHGLPVDVDRAALVVDQAGLEARPLVGVEVEVGVDLRAFLRPRDPEAVCRLEGVAEAREAPMEVVAGRGDEDDDAGAGLGAELLRERGRRIVLLRHGTRTVRDARCFPR